MKPKSLILSILVLSFGIFSNTYACEYTPGPAGTAGNDTIFCNAVSDSLIDALAGNDTVTIEGDLGVSPSDAEYVNLGEGDDTITVHGDTMNVTPGGAPFAGIDTGDGNNTVILDDSTVTRIRAGDDNDDITATDSTVSTLELIGGNNDVVLINSDVLTLDSEGGTNTFDFSGTTDVNSLITTASNETLTMGGTANLDSYSVENSTISISMSEAATLGVMDFDTGIGTMAVSGTASVGSIVTSIGPIDVDFSDDSQLGDLTFVEGSDSVILSDSATVTGVIDLGDGDDTITIGVPKANFDAETLDLICGAGTDTVYVDILGGATGYGSSLTLDPASGCEEVVYLSLVAPNTCSYSPENGLTAGDDVLDCSTSNDEIIETELTGISDGDDTVIIEGSSSTVAQIIMGSGDDEFVLDKFGVLSSGDSSGIGRITNTPFNGVQTFSGDDRVTIKGQSTIRNISTGSGEDTVLISEKSMVSEMILLGDDDDVITIRVSKDHFDATESGGQLSCGAGEDTVVIDASNGATRYEDDIVLNADCENLEYIEKSSSGGGGGGSKRRTNTTSVNVDPQEEILIAAEFGCTNSGALNYNPYAQLDNGSCVYSQETIPDNFFVASCSKVFNEYVEQGDRGSEVSLWQKFLNFGFNESIPETGYFGDQTRGGVKRFQEFFTGAILTPWGLTEGTGKVYQTTRSWANRLTGCPEEGFVVEGNSVNHATFAIPRGYEFLKSFNTDNQYGTAPTVSNQNNQPAVTVTTPSVQTPTTQVDTTGDAEIDLLLQAIIEVENKIDSLNES